MAFLGMVIILLFQWEWELYLMLLEDHESFIKGLPVKVAMHVVYKNYTYLYATKMTERKQFQYFEGIMHFSDKLLLQ